MASVEKGTTIERTSCSGCGRSVDVKVNKNGIAYYYCNGFSSDDGGSCSHHEKWGRVKSNEKIRAYYEHQKKARKEIKEDDSAKRTGQPEKADKGQSERNDEPAKQSVGGALGRIWNGSGGGSGLFGD